MRVLGVASSSARQRTTFGRRLPRLRQSGSRSDQHLELDRQRTTDAVGDEQRGAELSTLETCDVVRGKPRLLCQEGLRPAMLLTRSPDCLPHHDVERAMLVLAVGRPAWLTLVRIELRSAPALLAHAKTVAQCTWVSRRNCSVPDEAVDLIPCGKAPRFRERRRRWPGHARTVDGDAWCKIRRSMWGARCRRAACREQRFRAERVTLAGMRTVLRALRRRAWRPRLTRSAIRARRPRCG